MTSERLSLIAPPLWRDDTTMQFGVSESVHIEHPSPWQIELLMALEHGTTRSELGHLSTRLGVTRQAPGFLDHIASAIAVTTAPIRVGVISQGTPTEDADAADAAEALRSLPTATFDSTHPEVVWVVARDVVVPRSCRELMATDTTHLPIVITRSSIVVGPVITPGVSACASCLALHETDRDAAWPVLASQLVARWAQPLGAATWGEVARTATRLMAMPASAESVGYELSAMNQPRVRQYQLHADCGCQSPAGNARANGADDLHHEPTTTPACAPLA